MSWASDSALRRLCGRGGRRIHASAEGTGPRSLLPGTATANPQMRGGVMPPSDGSWRVLVPALAPHPTRREASGGVISYPAGFVEPLFEIVPGRP